MITCKNQTLAGQVTGKYTVGEGAMKFTGCTVTKGTGANGCAVKSTNTVNEGEIVTTPLKGQLGAVPTKEDLTAEGSERTPFDNAGSNLAGDNEVKVSATVLLRPNSEYVYCLVASRYGHTPGNEQPIITHAEKPHVISDILVSTGVEEGSFSAVINPEYEETTYTFEYSSEGSVSENELKNAQMDPGTESLPAEVGEERVAVGGATLEPDTKTFYYRVVATNEKGGTTIGPVQAYTKLPIVTDESSSDLTSASVRLTADVNPEFVETEYAFEYATGKEGKTAEEVLEDGEGTVVPHSAGTLAPPAPAHCHDGTLPAPSTGESFTCDDGSAPACASGAIPAPDGTILLCTIPVGVEVFSLQPGETYYYRVVTENEITHAKRNVNEGHPVAGPIQSFKAFAAPAAVTGEAQNITGTSATLSGEVNPQGEQTSYSFEYINEAAYEAAIAEGSSNPLGAGETTSPRSAGSGEAAVAAGPVPATDLLPGVTYHYRLVATNSTGVQGIGKEATFTTLPGPPSPTPPSEASGELPGSGSPIAVVASPPLIAYISPGFPKEEKGSGTTAKKLTNKQKLANALKACKKDHSKSKRMKCEAAAHRQYPTANAKKRKKK